MSTDDANFMAMLHEGGVTASSRWADVQRRHAGDPRFAAVVGEQRLLLFRDFVRMRQEVDDMQLSDAEKDYMARRLCFAVLVCWWCCGNAILGVSIETGIIELPRSSIQAEITMTTIMSNTFAGMGPLSQLVLMAAGQCLTSDLDDCYEALFWRVLYQVIFLCC